VLAALDVHRGAGRFADPLDPAESGHPVQEIEHSRLNIGWHLIQLGK
jgi:hypothetical protein